MASIESQVVELVRNWVEMHPLRGDVLSAADIHAAAAKIMLKQAKRNWRLGANARLGAILLVLFVHEGLEVGGGGSGESEPHILGIPMSEVYEMLEDVISEAGLTKRGLLDNVAEVDTIGSTTCLMQTMELSAALFPSEAPPAVRAPSLRTTGSGRSKQATSAEAESLLATLPYVESADLSSDIPDYYFKQMPMRQKLSQSFTRQRALLALLSVLGTSFSLLFGEWDFVGLGVEWGSVCGSLGTLSRDSRLVMYVVSVYSTSLLIMAAFPYNLSSAAGTQFLLPILVGSVLRCVGVVLDVYHTGPLVNPACTAVHRLTSVVLFGAWLSTPVQAWAGRFDWYWGRGIHMIEGVALVTCTLLIRALGPSEHYPPGGMSLSAALARGGLAIVLGGLVESPPNRRRLARLANHFGVNHVVLSLGDLDLNPVNHRDAYGAIRPPSLPEVTSGSSLTSPPRAASHHTSKMPPGAHYWVKPPSTLPSLELDVIDIVNPRSRCVRRPRGSGPQE